MAAHILTEYGINKAKERLERLSKMTQTPERVREIKAIKRNIEDAQREPAQIVTSPEEQARMDATMETIWEILNNLINVGRIK